MVSLFVCPGKTLSYVFKLSVLMSRALRPNPFTFAFHILPRRRQVFLFIAFSGMYTDLEFGVFILVLLWSDWKLYLTCVCQIFLSADCGKTLSKCRGKAKSSRPWRAAQDIRAMEIPWGQGSALFRAICYMDHMERSINIISEGT